MLLGRLKLVPEGVELRPWRSLEVRGSPELTRRALLQHNARRVIRKRVDLSLEALVAEATLAPQNASFLGGFWGLAGISTWCARL